jgi:hypothetical protein
MTDVMDLVDPLEPNLGCRHGDDPACERGVHQGQVVVDAKAACHSMTTAVAVRSPYHHDAWPMEECRTVRGLLVMASTDPAPAEEGCCVHIVKDHRPNPRGLSDGVGESH